MSQNFQNKTAIVTGGSRGIGFAIVKALLNEGANVAFCGQSEASASQAVQQLNAGNKVMAKVVDVRNAEQVDQFIEETEKNFGQVDILINNAGIGIFKPVGELSPEEWDQVIGTNLTGTFHFCRSALPYFRKQGYGQIINISSLAGKNPFAGGGAYNASKFGVNGFSDALMLDHRQENVRVSLIAPGSVDTEFSPRSGGGDSSWKIAPEDVAEAVLAILKMPERTLMSLVELRPSRPKKG